MTAHVAGAAVTAFGRQPGRTALIAKPVEVANALAAAEHTVNAYRALSSR